MLNPVTVSAFALPPRTALPDQQEQASVERRGGEHAVSKSLTPDSLTSLFLEKSERRFLGYGQRFESVQSTCDVVM